VSGRAVEDDSAPPDPLAEVWSGRKRVKKEYRKEREEEKRRGPRHLTSTPTYIGIIRM